METMMKNFSNDMLKRVWEALKPRLQIARVVTTAPECSLLVERCFISYSSAQNLFRFIMFQLVATSKAKYVKRGTWEILNDYSVDTIPALRSPNKTFKVDTAVFGLKNEPKPVPTQADLAAEKLLEVGFSDVNAWKIAEEYGVTVKSLLVAFSNVKAKPKTIEPEQPRQIDSYQFKKYEDD